VEFCVQVLLADQRVALGRTQTRTLEHGTVAEVERLQKLGPLVAKAFEGTSLGAADSATARCAAAIARSASDLVRAEAIRMRDALDAEIAKRDAQAAQERDGTLKALEAFVVKHDVPGTAVDVHLAIAGGVRYAGRARMKTGSAWTRFLTSRSQPATFSRGWCGSIVCSSGWTSRRPRSAAGCRRG
jgi:hypothetical protein